MTAEFTRFRFLLEAFKTWKTKCMPTFYTAWIQQKESKLDRKRCLWTQCLNTYNLDDWLNLIFRPPGWKLHMDWTFTEYMNYNSLWQNNFVLNTYIYFRFRRWSPTKKGNGKFGSIYSHLNTLTLAGRGNVNISSK